MTKASVATSLLVMIDQPRRVSPNPEAMIAGARLFYVFLIYG